MLGRWNCSGIAAIADDGVYGGNKRFVGGGQRPRKRKSSKVRAALRERYLVTSLLFSHD